MCIILSVHASATPFYRVTYKAIHKVCNSNSSGNKQNSDLPFRERRRSAVVLLNEHQKHSIHTARPLWWQIQDAFAPLYRVSRGECVRLRENVPYVKIHRSNTKHLYPKLNGYGDNGQKKVWSSCGSTYCTCFACCYPYTAHVRPSVSQLSQAHSAFIINRCHSYSEL